MTYTNFPVYIGRANSWFKTRSFDALNFMLLANKVSVSNSSSKVSNRKLGSWINQESQFGYNNDKKASISIEFYLKPNIRNSVNSDHVYGFLFDDETIFGNLKGNNNGKNYFPIRIGKMHFNRCHLRSYSVDIQPNLPVKVTASFDSKYYFGAETRPELRPPYEIYDEVLNSKDIIHGSSCELIGDYSQVAGENIFANMIYSKNFEIDYLYRPQDPRASDAFTKSVSSLLTIKGIDLESMAGTRGSNIETDLQINLKNNRGEQILEDFNPFKILIKSGAKVNQNSFSISGGDTLQSNISIEEINY